MKFAYFICLLVTFQSDAMFTDGQTNAEVLEKMENLQIMVNNEIQIMKRIIWIDLTGDVNKLKSDVLKIQEDLSKVSINEPEAQNQEPRNKSLREEMIIDALRKEKFVTRSLRKQMEVMQNRIDDLSQKVTLNSEREKTISQEMESVSTSLQRIQPNLDWLGLYKSEIKRVRSFGRPSFMSDWMLMKSQDADLSELSVEHGLGVLPYKVDVLVRPTDGPNAGWIFHGDTAFRNDDDTEPMYGGVVYFYDKTKVSVQAPKKSNNYDTGRIVYTGSQDSRRLGNHHQISESALVRVLVWIQGDLPVPEFESDWLQLDIRDNSTSFYELDHGLDDYPAMINVQIMNEKTGLISEGVGASVEPRVWLNGGGTVWGFNNRTVRIWSAFFAEKPEGSRSTYHKPIGGGDGWGKKFMTDLAADTAKVKVTAWSNKNVEMNQNFFTGKVDTNTFEFGPISNRFNPTNEDIVSFFIQATNGTNEGFRFRGYGGSHAKVEGFGGSVFAYNKDGLVRTWPPNPEKNGHLIHIVPSYGNGQHTQISDDAVYVYTMIKTWP